MSERNLVSIERIQDIRPIPDADNIVVAKIKGWDIVVGKDDFQVDDECLYFEIDSMLDVEDPRFAFLAPRGVRTDADGNKGHVLKTIRLRGQYSQGLALPLSSFPEIAEAPGDTPFTIEEILNVKKWEAPVPAELSGQARGMRPSWIWKTGAERVQNVDPGLFPLTGVYATEKIDGASVSFGIHNDEFHVCSHNVDLIERKGNTLWDLARKHDVETKMRSEMWAYGYKTLVVQGEAYGEGINGNRLGLKGQHLAIFNVEADGMVVPLLTERGDLDLPRVPVVGFPPPKSAEEALAQVEGMTSWVNPLKLAEGIVWRLTDGDSWDHFKAIKVISNKYLLKEK